MAKIDVKGASITVCSDGGKDYRLHAARIRQPHAGRGLSRQRLRGEPVGRQIGEISRPVYQVGSLSAQGVAGRLRPQPASRRLIILSCDLALHIVSASKN